jgi:hypothetical protein
MKTVEAIRTRELARRFAEWLEKPVARHLIANMIMEAKGDLTAFYESYSQEQLKIDQENEAIQHVGGDG